MTNKRARILAPVVCLMGVTFTPISKSKLENYKSKQIEYSEKLKNHKEFVGMCEEYKNDYTNLADKYEQIQADYISYKKKFNENRNLNKELADLKKKREKYLNLIEEYSAKLHNF